jgi:hypothetical protein
MVSHTLAFVAIGECVGALVVVSFAKLSSELLYGVTPNDPLILGSVMGFLFLISLGSAAGPAWSAGGRDAQRFLR